MKGEINTMLTKELLKYSVRKGSLNPRFLKKDRPTQDCVKGFIHELTACLGQTITDIDARLSATMLPGQPYLAGMKKVVLSRAEYQEPPDMRDPRMNWLKQSQDCRKRAVSYEDWQELWSSTTSDRLEDVQNQIYLDLGSQKKLVKIEQLSTCDWIDRYNLALFQGLMCHACSIEVQMPRSNIAELRFVLRQARFFQLAMDVQSAGEDFIIVVEGPLKVLGKRTGYGLKFAGFASKLLSCGSWSASILLELKKKEVIYKISDKIPLKTNYKTAPSYIPPELATCLSTLSSKTAVAASVDVDLCEVGDSDFIVPDFKVTYEGIEYLIELFHQWHAGGLGKRIGQVSSLGDHYVMGVQKSLARSEAGQNIISRMPKGTRYFVFSQFPTAKAILAQLKA